MKDSEKFALLYEKYAPVGRRKEYVPAGSELMLSHEDGVRFIHDCLLNGLAIVAIEYFVTENGEQRIGPVAIDNSSNHLRQPDASQKTCAAALGRIRTDIPMAQRWQSFQYMKGTEGNTKPLQHVFGSRRCAARIVRRGCIARTYGSA